MYLSSSTRSDTTSGLTRHTISDMTLFARRKAMGHLDWGTNHPDANTLSATKHSTKRDAKTLRRTR